MQLLGLQKYAAKDYAGMVNYPAFGQLYQESPELVSNMIKEIFRVNLIDDMMAFIQRFPEREVSETKPYEWDLQGQHEKNVPLADWYDADGNKPAEPGKNGAAIFLVFDEDYFEPTNVLVGHKEDYHFLVKESRQLSGGRFELRCELVTPPDSGLFVPPDELAVGKRFSKDYDLVPSTLSYEGARPNFTSPFRMRNRISMMRMEYDVAGNMIAKGKNDPLLFNFMYNGKPEKAWINYQDMVAYAQFNQMYSRMLLYGKRNWNAKDIIMNKDDKNRYDIVSGSGLFEQIAPGNVHYYSTYNIDWHLKMLLDLGVGRMERSKRVITLGTGEFGALQFHLAAQNNSTKYTPNFTQERIYKTAAGGLGTSMGMGYGGQFLEYDYVNGVKVKLEIIPFFDDRVRFKDEHPLGGVTESYRMIALDYGGESGIYRVKVRGQEPIFAYLNGLRDPFTPGGSGTPKQVVSKIDGYSVIRAMWGGLYVEDPTKIIDLRYNQA